MAASMALTTLAKVKAYLGLSGTEKDELLGALIDSASEAIENYCCRTFALAQRSELHDGSGGPVQVLRCWPVESVDDVRLDARRAFADDTQLATDTYTVYPESGILRRTDGIFPIGVRNMCVTYTAGFTAVPPSLEQAANALVGHFYTRGNQGGDGLAGESIGVYSVSYDTSEWPSQVRALLADFRTVTL